ncbi:DUF2892 domain-containing protein [Duganella sp. FT92W]|uniref:DUF2892 domain-containing protein n=1 Tax=Pseudoduganella rivuli TaxID=2666085 RepID=A0A7X2IQ11_9BURK|nr:DUF2892 domain-containing protein [Pseudoduganella rivuli]MRV73914.1 DUF2892 domain-containing protein [Pseudoduganella rivuli]
MKCNVGWADRLLRGTVGAGLLGATWAGAIGIWGWVGLVPLVTAAIAFCPAYLPFGFSTAEP